MFLIPASAVEPGQLLTFALLQSFFCCSKHFLNTCAVKQFHRSFHKCIMQHMHMCIHKTGQHQPSLKVNPFFAGKSFRFFISSHKNDPTIFDSHSLCHFFTVIQCSYTSVKKIVSTVYFSSFLFLFYPRRKVFCRGQALFGLFNFAELNWLDEMALLDAWSVLG